MTPARWRRSSALLPLLAATFAIGVRLAWLEQGTTRLNGDEAVTVIMAQRIAHGAHYVWFAHQQYMGAFEQYLAAPFVALLPAGQLTFHAAQLLIIGVTAGLLVMVARQIGLSEGRAAAAVAFWTVGPWTNVFYGTATMGAYATAQLLGVGGTLIALRYATTPRPRQAALLFGFICGFAVYENMQAAFLLIPAGVWIVGSRRRIVSLLAFAAVGGVIGLSPVLYWAAVHGTGGNFLGFAHPQRLTTAASRAANLLTHTLPAFVGTLWPSETPAASFLPWDVLPLGLLAALGAAAHRLRCDLRHVAVLASARARPLALPVSALLLAVVPVIFVERSMFDVVGQYLFCLYPSTAILGAAALPRRRSQTFIVGALIVALLASTLAIADRRAYLYRFGIGLAGLRDPTYAEDRGVIRWLNTHHVRAFGAHYWLSLPIKALATDGLDVFTLDNERFPVDRRRAVQTGLVVLGALPWDAPRVRKLLARRGATAREVSLGRVTLFVDVPASAIHYR